MKREKQEDATLTKKGAKRQSEIKKRAAQAKERLKMPKKGLFLENLHQLSRKTGPRKNYF